MTDITNDSCLDKPSVNDYVYSEIFGQSSAGYSSIRELNKTPIQDQSAPRDPKTDYACTCFGISHAINEENFVEGSDVSITGQDLWDLALELGADINTGWSLQGALKLAKSEGYIDGYSIVTDIDGIKSSINNNMVIYTGSNMINRNGLASNGRIATFKKGYGHAFCIIGFDDNLELFKCRNSYGLNRYDEGHFYVNYVDINMLYSMYAVIDHKNVDILNVYKAKNMEEAIQQMKELGITNGDNMQGTATREMVVVMLSRMYNVIMNQINLKI